MSFASFPLDKLGLSPAQLAACQRAGLSIAADILLPSPLDLNKKLKFSKPSLVNDLITAVSKAVAPSSSRVDEILGLGQDEGKAKGRKTLASQNGGSLSQGEWIRTGDEGLDQLLGGGVRIGCITEIAGESASGKSHLCLSLALAAQLSSLTPNPGGTIILTSERDLATSRLQELAGGLLPKYATSEFITVKMMMDNIHTTRCKDIEGLDHALSYVIPAMLEGMRSGFSSAADRGRARSSLMGWKLGPAEGDEQGSGLARPIGSMTTSQRGKTRPIRLLVLDSITALLRGAETSFSSSSAGLKQRSRHLCIVADRLKALAVEYNLAIVVINQVSDVFSKSTNGFNPTITTTAPRISSSVPGLGGNTSTNGNGNGNAYPASQNPSSQLPGHSQAFYTEGDDPPMRYSTQARWFSGQSEKLAKEAALGIVWANAVNTRIMLSRTGRRRLLDLSSLEVKRSRLDVPGVDSREGENREYSEKPTLIRRAHLVFSPFAPPATVDYIIGPSGVYSLPDSYKLEDDGEAVKKKTSKKRKGRLSRDDGDDDDDEEDKDDNHGLGEGTIRKFGQGDEVLDDYGDIPSEFWDPEWEAEEGEYASHGAEQRDEE